MKTKKETDIFEAGDHEVGMATGQLEAICKDATELLSKIGKAEKDIPGWIQGHITSAYEYLKQANDNYHELMPEGKGTKNRVKLFEQFLSEKKSDYEVYHNSYSSAVDAALEYAKSRGYEVVMDDVWNEISVGPKKPSEGKTNKATIALTKDGKPQRKALQIQIYGMGNRYELNAYIN